MLGRTTLNGREPVARSAAYGQYPQFGECGRCAPVGKGLRGTPSEHLDTLKSATRAGLPVVILAGHRLVG